MFSQPVVVLPVLEVPEQQVVLVQVPVVEVLPDSLAEQKLFVKDSFPCQFVVDLSLIHI